MILEEKMQIDWIFSRAASTVYGQYDVLLKNKYLRC